ncbi:unnamed protein product [Leptidea sinapis]|uniref:Protein kinase domain-containing protein n=1 Tax=Leptidea sinapis TaxID=189913 RepID=A0A5E4QH39_9NEOP|nr:unnamed protein product [Leptidea sinapis]
MWHPGIPGTGDAEGEHVRRRSGLRARGRFVRIIRIHTLVGCPPFWHRKQMVMLRNIMEGKYSFTSPEWVDISEDPKDLIRRFLVVDPMERIKISDALGHPFFHTKLWDQDVTPLKKSLSTTSRRMSRIDQIALRFQRARQVTTRPDNRPRRSAVIDGCAFRVYGHWVKKGEGQNRAALFENTPKTELKSLYVSNLMERIYQESNS